MMPVPTFVSHKIDTAMEECNYITALASKEPVYTDQGLGMKANRHQAVPTLKMTKGPIRSRGTVVRSVITESLRTKTKKETFPSHICRRRSMTLVRKRS